MIHSLSPSVRRPLPLHHSLLSALLFLNDGCIKAPDSLKWPRSTQKHGSQVQLLLRYPTPTNIQSIIVSKSPVAQGENHLQLLRRKLRVGR